MNRVSFIVTYDKEDQMWVISKLQKLKKITFKFELPKVNLTQISGIKVIFKSKENVKTTFT